MFPVGVTPFLTCLVLVEHVVSCYSVLMVSICYIKDATAPAKLQPSSQTSAAGSQWEAEELQRKQDELDKRAAELDRREQEMQRTMQFQGAALC